MVVAIQQEKQGRRADSFRELRTFGLQVFFPFAGLISLTIIALTAIQFWSADVANRNAVMAAQDLAQSGIRHALLDVGSNATAGDEVLRQVAKRLRAGLRGDDFVSRVGGDEFVVVQSARDQGAANSLASRLVLALTAPIVLQDTAVSVGASIGIAFASGVQEVSSDLVRKADLALYDAKRAGGNQYRAVPALLGTDPKRPLQDLSRTGFVAPASRQRASLVK